MPDWDIMPLHGGYHEAYLLYGHIDEAAAREELLGWDERLMPEGHPLRVRTGDARWVPDATGECRQALHWAAAPGRGTFPCTQVELMPPSGKWEA